MIGNSIAGFLGTGVAASTSSFESIATASGNGSATTISFTGIVGTYKSLQIRCLLRGQSGSIGSEAFNIRLNTDSGNNYSWHQMYGNGSTITANAGSTTNLMNFERSIVGNGALADTMGAAVIDIVDYASTSKYKTIRTISGADTNSSAGYWGINLSSGLWQSTSAVTQIDMFSGSGTAWSSTARFALYGIKG